MIYVMWWYLLNDHEFSWITMGQISHNFTLTGFFFEKTLKGYFSKKHCWNLGPFCWERGPKQVAAGVTSTAAPQIAWQRVPAARPKAAPPHGVRQVLLLPGSWTVILRNLYIEQSMEKKHNLDLFLILALSLRLQGICLECWTKMSTGHFGSRLDQIQHFVKKTGQSPWSNHSHLVFQSHGVFA